MNACVFLVTHIYEHFSLHTYAYIQQQPAVWVTLSHAPQQQPLQLFALTLNLPLLFSSMIDRKYARTDILVRTHKLFFPFFVWRERPLVICKCTTIHKGVKSEWWKGRGKRISIKTNPHIHVQSSFTAMSKRSLCKWWTGLEFLFMWVTPICLPSPTILLHCLYYVLLSL